MMDLCIGNGQLHQVQLTEVVGALNCMHDQQAVITYGLDRASFNQGKNALYDFTIDEELSCVLKNLHLPYYCINRDFGWHGKDNIKSMANDIYKLMR